MNKLILIFISLLIFSCGTVSIKSTPPEASIGVIIPGKEDNKVLGKTPYMADLSDLDDIVNSGPIILVIKKKGYIPQQFIVPNLSGGKLEIEANLFPNLPTNYKEINHIVSLVLNAERFLLQKRFKEALNLASEIIKVNENVAAAYEIKGAVYFLQNKLKQSRFAWIRTLELDPNNPEAQTMLAKIEKKLKMTSTKVKK